MNTRLTIAALSAILLSSSAYAQSMHGSQNPGNNNKTIQENRMEERHDRQEDRMDDRHDRIEEQADKRLNDQQQDRLEDRNDRQEDRMQDRHDRQEDHKKSRHDRNKKDSVNSDGLSGKHKDDPDNMHKIKGTDTDPTNNHHRKHPMYRMENNRKAPESYREKRKNTHFQGVGHTKK